MLHIYHLCNEYFKFDVTTNIRVSIPDDVYIPSYTFCFEAAEILLWNKTSLEQRKRLLIGCVNLVNVSKVLEYPVSDNLTEFRSILFNPNPYDTSCAVYNNMVRELTLHEIFQLTLNLSHLLKSTHITPLLYSSFETNWFYNFNTSAIDFPFDIKKTYLMRHRKCFQLELKQHLQKPLSYDHLSVHTLGMITLNKWVLEKHMTSVSYYVAPNNYMITSMDPRISVVDRHRLQTTYDIYKSLLLEYPYKTGCTNYRNFGHDSRSHCRQDCFKRKVSEKYGAIPSDSVAIVLPSDNLPLKLTEDIGVNATEREKWRLYCFNQCLQKDCSSVIHIPRILSDKPGSDSSNIIRTLASSNPVMVTKTQAAIPLISFLTNAFSTFGIWMGLSVFGSILHFKHFVTKINNYVNRSSLSTGFLERQNVNRHPRCKTIILVSRANSVAVVSNEGVRATSQGYP